MKVNQARLLCLLGEESLKNGELKEEIEALKAQAEEDAKVKLDQSHQITDLKKENAKLEQTLGWNSKEIPVLRGAIRDRREEIAELKLDNKDLNNVIDLLQANIREKNEWMAKAVKQLCATGKCVFYKESE